MDAPTLVTPRLILRPLSQADFDDYAAMWADERVTRFIGGEPRDRTTSWAKFLSAAGLWPLCGFGYWTFTDRETGAFLGNGGLSRFERGIPELEGVAEAGWAIAPAGWGRGLATEAMQAVLNWGHAELALPEVRCIIDPENAPSRRVAAKLGFTQFAETRDAKGDILLFRKTFAPAT